MLWQPCQNRFEIYLAALAETLWFSKWNTKLEQKSTKADQSRFEGYLAALAEALWLSKWNTKLEQKCPRAGQSIRRVAMEDLEAVVVDGDELEAGHSGSSTSLCEHSP